MTSLSADPTRSNNEFDAASQAMFASIAMRLSEEFGHRYSTRVVEDVIVACRQDLAGSPPGALPELVERLARQRLRSGWASFSAQRLGPG
ncbi:MAG TPA: hypothetical protein VGH11_04985 [Jatrophihabitans sp.]|jgi:hypothetical protein